MFRLAPLPACQTWCGGCRLRARVGKPCLADHQPSRQRIGARPQLPLCSSAGGQRPSGAGHRLVHPGSVDADLVAVAAAAQRAGNAWRGGLRDHAGCLDLHGCRFSATEVAPCAGGRPGWPRLSRLGRPRQAHTSDHRTADGRQQQPAGLALSLPTSTFLVATTAVHIAVVAGAVALALLVTGLRLRNAI